MLDILAFGVAATLLTIVIAFLLIRVRVPRKAAVVTALFLAMLITSYFVMQVSRSRSFQFFGHLITARSTRGKVVALTLDDGPTSQYTPEILATLRKHGVKATFFLIGADIERAPEAAKMIAAEGHEIGNHSYSHRRMVFKSERWIRSEIERTDALIRKSGYTGPIHFRSPYGKRLLSLPWYLAREKRLNIFFDVEPESHPEVERSRELLVRHVVENARPGSIILLHPMYANRAVTREALPAIIEGLTARGYRFVTVSELLRTE